VWVNLNLPYGAYKVLYIDSAYIVTNDISSIRVFDRRGWLTNILRVDQYTLSFYFDGLIALVKGRRIEFMDLLGRDILNVIEMPLGMYFQQYYILDRRMILLFCDGNNSFVIEYDNKLNVVQSFYMNNSILSNVATDELMSKIYLSGVVRIGSPSGSIRKYNPSFPAFTQAVFLSLDSNYQYTYDQNVVFESFNVDEIEFTDTINRVCHLDSIVKVTLTGVECKILNKGKSPIYSYTLSYGYGLCHIYCHPWKRVDTTISMTILPGQEFQLKLDNVVIPLHDIKSEFELCLWVSAPNGKLERNLSDNEICKTIKLENFKPKIEDCSIRLINNPGPYPCLKSNCEMAIDEIELYTYSGKLVGAVNNHGQMEYCIDRNRVSSGVYLLRVNEDKVFKVFVL